jgi:Ca2+-transporting ATPase
MAAAHAIVRKLPAIETLGAATAICSDKTGTLTRNEMTVRAIFCAGSVIEVGGSGYIPEGDFACEGKPLAADGPVRRGLHQTLNAAALVNDAALSDSDGRWSVQGDPTEGALLVAARKFGISDEHLARQQRVAEIPFTSERKRHTTVHIDPSNPAELTIMVKGAPEILLSRCRYIMDRGQPILLSGPARAEIAQRNDELASQALRVLAIATRRMSATSLGIDPRAPAAEVELSESIEEDLILLGLVGMIDPPRPEVKDAVRVAREAGIRTVMITGDHPATAGAIAQELAILEPGSRIVTGGELRAMDEPQLDGIVDDVRVFARVDPDHKLRIVQSLQRKGHIVAMTGDGINDAPALKTANIGVAMGITGTDVSKEAADMVLTDDNFASIVKAIEEGRGVYDNIQKYLLYLLSTNSGELMTMFAGVMFAGWLGLISVDVGLFLPLLAAQLLWINLVTDGPPALALGVDPKDRDVMKRAPRRHGSGILLNEDWVRLAAVGLLMMVGTVWVLDAYYPGGLFSPFATGTGPNAYDEAHARTMAFTTLMMYQLFDVYNCRSRRRSAFNGFVENYWLMVAIAFALGTHVLVVYVPILQTAFHTVALTGQDWIVATLVAASLLIGMETAKIFLRRLRPVPH